LLERVKEERRRGQILKGTDFLDAVLESLAKILGKQLFKASILVNHLNKINLLHLAKAL